jgi:heme/copper-type cytochrome/quinol oxidase subunit 2
VIRLRRTLERGRAHPVIGPILLIVLALLLAMVFVHAAHDGHDAAVEVGAMCLAILTILGPILLELARRFPPATVMPQRGDRGPPSATTVRRLTRPPQTAFAFGTPLRR